MKKKLDRQRVVAVIAIFAIVGCLCLQFFSVSVQNRRLQRTLDDTNTTLREFHGSRSAQFDTLLCISGTLPNTTSAEVRQCFADFGVAVPTP